MSVGGRSMCRSVSVRVSSLAVHIFNLAVNFAYRLLRSTRSFNMTQSCLLTHTHTHAHLTDLHANCTVKQLVLCHAPAHAATAATAKQLNIYATQAANKIRQKAAKGTKRQALLPLTVVCKRYVCVSAGYMYTIHVKDMCV